MMLSQRMMIAVIVSIALLLLVAFNAYRWEMLTSCLERGGVWDGVDSRCRLIPRIIIKRDLERT